MDDVSPINRTVNTLYCRVKSGRQFDIDNSADDVRIHMPGHPNITVTRRQNVIALFQTYAEEALAGGTPPKGLEQAFAATLEISPSMWSQIKAGRPIGDKLARQIEQHRGKPTGWLDSPHTSPTLNAAEQAFLQLALRAWRASNAVGRRSLKATVSSILETQG